MKFLVSAVWAVSACMLLPHPGSTQDLNALSFPVLGDNLKELSLPNKGPGQDFTDLTFPKPGQGTGLQKPDLGIDLSNPGPGIDLAKPVPGLGFPDSGPDLGLPKPGQGLSLLPEQKMPGQDLKDLTIPKPEVLKPQPPASIQVLPTTLKPQDETIPAQAPMELTQVRGGSGGDFNYHEWQSWSECLEVSGGCFQARRRQCRQDKVCEQKVEVTVSKCDVKKCSKEKYYTQWTTWSQCSKSCGRGTKTRSRTCQHGKECTGRKHGSTTCWVKSCEGDVQLNSMKCGERVQKKKVVGGRDARVSAWPWQVGLIKVHYGMSYNDRMIKKTFCGGSLINPRTVLTAAHCLVGFKPTGFNVRLGDHGVKTKEVDEEVIEVEKFIIHQGHRQSPSVIHDIALVILKKDATLNANGAVNTVCVPSGNGNEGFGKGNCFVTGWGLTKEGGDQANVLQQVKIDAVSKDECIRSFRRQRQYVSHRDLRGMLCAGKAGGKGGKDACQGDSGGPMMCKVNSQFVIRGIVSNGIGCGRKGLYGMYTNVEEYVHWIRKNI